MTNTDLIPSERIEKAIYLIRGEKVMLDRDLALLYGVETKVLNRAVKRNLRRFPADFMLPLTPEEADSLRCQIGTSNKGRGRRRLDRQTRNPPLNKQLSEFLVRLNERC